MFIFQFFRNLKITHKLGLLLFSILAGFASIAGAYWLVLTNQQDSDLRTAEFIEFGQHISEAQQSYFKVRRFEKDFLLSISAATGRTYNEAPLEEHNKQMSRLQAHMQELSQLAPEIDRATIDTAFTDIYGNPVNYMTRLVGQAQSVAEDYKRSFDDIVRFNKVVGLSSEQGLRGQVNALSSQLRDQITAIDNAQLAASLVQMSVNLQQILQSTDLTQVYEELKLDHAKFVSALGSEEKLSNSAKRNLVSIANNYMKAVDGIVDNKRRANEYTELYDFMLGPIFDEMVDASMQFVASNQQTQQVKTTQITQLVTYSLLGIFLIISTLLYLFGKSFINPILAVQTTIHQVNQGDTSARTHLRRKDEIGQLASAFDQLLDERVSQLAHSELENERLNNSIVELLKSVAKLSQKDFTIQVPVFEDVTGAVGDSLNLLSKETSDALSDVRRISHSVAEAADEIRQHSDVLLKVAESGRNQVEDTVNKLRLTSKTMSDISTEAQQVNNQAGSALKNTETALLTVNQTIQGINAIRETISETEKRIKRLGERSQEITGVVNLINSIAERTHILALNASMHAASAGEAGRGFAVVADEVQRLAENAREATTEIGTLVSNIKAETADTVTAMNNAITQVAQGTQMAEQAGLAMRNTQKSTEDLVHSVEHIAVSSLEQSRATTELVERANEIVSGTRQTDKYLKIQNVSTAQLTEYSSQLVATVSVFKLPESSLQRNSFAVPELQQVIESQDSDVVRKKAQSS